jgi:hypothetical protein
MAGKENTINPSDVYKTGALASLAQTVTLPFLLRLGFAPTTAFIGVGLYLLHERGRSKQGGAKWYDFFGTRKNDKPIASNDIPYNIFVGGGDVFDELFPNGPSSSKK